MDLLDCKMTMVSWTIRPRGPVHPPTHLGLNVVKRDTSGLGSVRAVLLLSAVTVVLATPVFAQQPPLDPPPESKRVDVFERTPPFQEQVRDLKHALSRLPVAAGLACVLAFRPRRKGTPPRQAPVIQTQIILAVVGAVVMLVVGSSLARAFGIVGAAGLVRYRAKIEDPKDAGVMLSTLAVGLAAGVGVWLLASFATLFILALLWVVESMEPTPTELFALRIKAKDPGAVKGAIDALLTRYRLPYELRATSKEELVYEVRIPTGGNTERMSDRMLKLDPANITEVAWEDKKDKK
jgi:hypothetical protein